MSLYYHSTRDRSLTASASQAIISGIAPDGGLFVPSFIPKLTIPLENLAESSYDEIAYAVLSTYLTDFTETELLACIQVYQEKFLPESVTPLVKVKSSYYLELFHGPTLAFKDVALSILPKFMTRAAKKNNNDKDIVILTATSGDTGKAALDGFANVPGTRIIVFYPKDGVSEFQERQMLTQSGHNVSVIAVEGNFDDAQNEVKNLFVDEKLKKELTENNLMFSSANSINIGRLIPQIVYYIHAYGQLLNDNRIHAGDFMNVTIPTGNFGNILAAYYAQQMGLPIKKLIVASNENNVLSDFFHSGIYNRKREFIRTQSPSMDILVSSNLERLLYHLSNDTDTVKNYMTALSKDGFYKVTAEIMAKAEDFYADFASEIDILQEIKRVFDETGYLLDPHTAVASVVAEKHNDHLPMVIAATASSYKFPKTVLTALEVDLKSSTLESALLHLAKLNKQTLPLSVEKALYDDFLHHTSIPISKMKQAVREKLHL